MGRLIDDNDKEWWAMTKAVGMQVKGAVKSEGRWKKEPGRVKKERVVPREQGKKPSKRNGVETVSLGGSQVSGTARK